MNKKQLSGLLIPMLAFYSANINAMEKNICRNKSTEIKRKTKTDRIEIERIVIADNKKLLKEGKQGVCMYSGPAYSGLIQKYDILERYFDTCMKQGLTPQHFVESAGHVGSVSKCRLKGTNKIFAVKFEPYPEKTGIITENNNTAHVDDRKRELQFYKDTKTLWKDKKWATKLYDRFEDENGVYTVTDWVEGETLAQFCKKMKNKSLKEKLKQAFEIGTQINNIIKDFENAGKMNTDMHEDNIMIEKNGNVRVVDHGKYFNISIFNIFNIEKDKVVASGFLTAISYLLNSLLDFPTLYKDYKKYKYYKSEYILNHRYDDESHLNAHIYDSIIKHLGDLCALLDTNGKLRVPSSISSLEDIDCSQFDHCGRSKLIDAFHYLYLDIHHSGK